MKFSVCSVFLLLWNAALVSGDIFGAFGVFSIAASVAVETIFQPLSCMYWKECCTPRHISFNETALKFALETKLHGQHLAKQVVTRQLIGYTKLENPSKALTFSFHGGTGTGKNHVSKIIAESIYRKGMQSKYVHFFSATRDFPHKEMVKLYQEKLKNEIEESVRSCAQSLFIFDEVDKVPAGVLDIIKPYLDSYEHIEHVNFRKSIFIFLSNDGATSIQKLTTETWHKARPRESITLKDAENLILKEAINSEKSGFYHSRLLSHHMISAYIPFLPMERKHVRRCIKDYLLDKKKFSRESEIPMTVVDDVVEELSFFPEDNGLFSVTGCKRVPEKADFITSKDYLDL